MSFSQTQLINDSESNTLLYGLLTYKRPANSQSERDFINTFLSFEGTFRDEFGNIHYSQGESRTLFSCHTDTVHNGVGKQTVYIDPQTGTAFGTGNDVLGADDGAGVYVMLRLIDAGVPGYYIFHREEEIGGNGSRWIADNVDLSDFDRAIAFDRAGTRSVITHQGFTRCCSDEFALELAVALGGEFMPDDTGTFTDTANYDQVIPECTNISVGYKFAHSKKEELDVDFLDDLVDTLINLDFESLCTVRDPSVLEYKYDSDEYQGNFHDKNDSYYWPESKVDILDAIDACDFNRLVAAIADDPYSAAELLLDSCA